jgi:predicted secreted protein
MNPLPHAAETIDLLKWVAAHPNQPFDPNMVVSLSTNHTSDWEWQAVLNQMNSLRQQNYVMQLKQDPSGSTYWTLTTSGANYLHALERFEKTKGQTEQTPPPAAEITTPMASPIQTPKKHVAPFLERASLRIRHLIR